MDKAERILIIKIAEVDTNKISSFVRVKIKIMRKIQVLVIGSSDDTANSDAAYLIGKYIALKKLVLVTGGRSGVMSSVSQGASDNNGIVVGILPGETFDGANDYCNIVIPTGVGYARNLINVLSSDFIISISGKSGTLSELVYAWQYNKPVISCTFTGGWSKKITEIEIDEREGREIYSAESIEQVYLYIDKLTAVLRNCS